MPLTMQQRYEFILQGHSEQEVDDPCMVIKDGQLYCSQCYSHCTLEHLQTNRHQWRLGSFVRAQWQKGKKGKGGNNKGGKGYGGKGNGLDDKGKGMGDGGKGNGLDDQGKGMGDGGKGNGLDDQGKGMGDGGKGSGQGATAQCNGPDVHTLAEALTPVIVERLVPVLVEAIVPMMVQQLVSALTEALQELARTTSEGSSSSNMQGTGAEYFDIGQQSQASSSSWVQQSEVSSTSWIDPAANHVENQSKSRAEPDEKTAFQ
jgi:hypothetical protein